MTTRSSLATALALAAGAAALPASALAGPGDASATREYIAADLALVQTARSHLLRSEHAPLEVLAQVRRDCPMAGAGSPQNPESTQMSDEVIGTMVLSAARPDTAAIRSFIAKASSLRWSDARLTRAVRTYTRKLTTLLGLAVPHLCSDVAAWATDGFHSLPASTVAFVGRFMPAWVALGELPGALKAHESPEQRSVAARCSRIEVELTDGEARAVESWGKIMTELSLFP
jgi:hypothetical protein